MNASKYLLICLLCCYGSCAFAAAAEAVVRSHHAVKSSYSEQLTQGEKSLVGQAKKVCSKQGQELEQKSDKVARKEKLNKTKKSAFSRMFGLLLPNDLKTTFH